MISLYRSSGTLLYPLLGRGYHQSVYGNCLSPYSELTISKCAKLLLQYLTDASSVTLALLAVFYLATREWKIRGREAILSLVVGAAIGKVVICLAAGGTGAYRYSFPYVAAAILVLLTAALSHREAAGQKKLGASASFVAGALALFLVGSAWDGSRGMYLDCLRCIRQGLANIRLVSDQEEAEYRNLQQSVPAGEVILTRLDKPFLLDFNRNTVFVCGLPGRGESPARHTSR